MEKRNVLLITYYWPPSGGAGVHRWLRFSRYFSENNCNLTVYCPEDAAWQIRDEELLNQVPKNITVIRRKIFEPHKYLGKKGGAGIGFTQEKRASLFKRFIIWIRGNIFLPDSRAFWIRPSARFLNSYLKNHPEIDTVISSGPPHSLHLIAKRLKRKHNFKWIADFRDPWTQIDFYEDLMPGKWADSKQKKWEKEVLSQADEVVTISKTCADGLEEIVNRKVHVITNGFIFPEFDEQKAELDKKFTISHFGSMPFARNPEVLWNALNELLKENNTLQHHLAINLIGTVDFKVIESAKGNGLEKYIHLIPPVSHSESISRQRSTQILLLVANNTGNVKGILTGKFFEYLGAKRPIFAIGTSDSDLERAVENTDCGVFVEYEEVEKAKEFIRNSFEAYLKNELYSVPKNIEQYSSKELTKKFIDLI